jgi:hypothetical protein
MPPAQLTSLRFFCFRMAKRNLVMALSLFAILPDILLAMCAGEVEVVMAETVLR